MEWWWTGGGLTIGAPVRRESVGEGGGRGRGTSRICTGALLSKRSDDTGACRSAGGQVPAATVGSGTRGTADPETERAGGVVSPMPRREARREWIVPNSVFGGPRCLTGVVRTPPSVIEGTFRTLSLTLVRVGKVDAHFALTVSSVATRVGSPVWAFGEVTGPDWARSGANCSRRRGRAATGGHCGRIYTHLKPLGVRGTLEEPLVQLRAVHRAPACYVTVGRLAIYWHSSHMMTVLSHQSVNPTWQNIFLWRSHRGAISGFAQVPRQAVITVDGLSRLSRLLGSSTCLRLSHPASRIALRRSVPAPCRPRSSSTRPSHHTSHRVALVAWWSVGVR